MARTAEPSLSLAQLQQLMHRRQGELSKLERKRSTLARKLDAIERRITEIGGGFNGRRGRTRARNDQSLVEVIHGVLTKAGEAMRVSDIADAVRKAGYQSTSPNFRSMVNQQLIKDKRFSSASRGFYQAKK
jgi:hypothetical protein